MDRRDFLWVTGSAGAGVALAAAPSFLGGTVLSTGTAKGGGRALIAENMTARASHGAFAFSLARFAEDSSVVAPPKRAVSAAAPALLSPQRDVLFHGFAKGAGAFADDGLRVVAVHHTLDGVTARHELWSHSPLRSLGGGGTSSAALFTAHDNAFGGFEITHIPASGPASSGFFGFMASGLGPQLIPGVYVLAGPSAATGVAPDLGRYAYTGNPSAPVRENRVLGLDFTYLSFVVHGEWV